MMAAAIAAVAKTKTNTKNLPREVFFVQKLNLALLKTIAIFAPVLTKGVSLHNNHLHKY
jgi:hypothetical protein